MNTLPNNWQVKSLGEVAKFINGRAFKPEEWGNKGLPIIRIQNLTGFSDVFNYYDGDFEKKYLVKKNDILISWSASLGVYVWDKDVAVLNQHIFKVELGDNFDRVFFYYLIKTKIDEIVSHVHGSTMKHITKDRFDNIKVKLPPLPIQKQIAEILEKADQAKQKRKEANKLTDEFLQSVFIEMFGDPVKNPKGWETKLISEIAKVGTGGTPSREKSEYFTGEIPWVKTTEVTNDRIFNTEEKITKEAFEDSHCVIFPKGTIIIALYGQGLTRGRTSILEIEACTNQACGTILPSKNFDSIFLWKQLLHFYNYLRSISRGGNQPNLNLSFIKNLRIIIPPLSFQQQFSEIVNKTESLKEKQKQSEQELENLFQSLMQKAFKGELVA